MTLDVFLESARGRLSRPQHDECLDDVASRFIGARHNRGIGHRGMLDEAILDFGWTDAVAGCLEHVVGAALVPEVAVVVCQGEIAGAAPIAGELFRRALRVLEVLEEENRVGRAVRSCPMHRHFAQFANSRFLAVVGDDAYAVPRIRAAHGPGLRRPKRVRVADDVVHLGLAEHFIDRHAERILCPCEYRRADGLAGAHHAAQREVETRARRGHRLHHHLQRRREEEGVSHTVLRHQRQRSLGVEPSPKAQDRTPEVERRQQRIHEAAGPCPIRGRPKQVVVLREYIVRVDKPGQVAEQTLLRHQRTLGGSCRATGVDQERRIGGAGGDGVEAIGRHRKRRLPILGP